MRFSVILLSWKTSRSKTSIYNWQHANAVLELVKQEKVRVFCNYNKKFTILQWSNFSLIEKYQTVLCQLGPLNEFEQRRFSLVQIDAFNYLLKVNVNFTCIVMEILYWNTLIIWADKTPAILDLFLGIWSLQTNLFHLETLLLLSKLFISVSTLSIPRSNENYLSPC